MKHANGESFRDTAGVVGEILDNHVEGARLPFHANQYGVLQVQTQAHVHIAEHDVLAVNWAAIDDATDTLADSLDHVHGLTAISFNKVDGTNHTFGGITNTITSISLEPYHINGGFFTVLLKLPAQGDYANTEYFALRLGTDVSNYTEWRMLYDDLETDVWQTIKVPLNHPDAYVGNGWNSDDITYVAIGFEFANENDAVAGILFDGILCGQGIETTTQGEIGVVGGFQKVNIFRLRNQNIARNAGNVGNDTLRITLADDDPAVVAAQAFGRSGLPVHGYDALGELDDGYATVVTAPARECHYVAASVAANGMIISLDGGTTEHLALPANSERVYSGLIIPSGADIQAKNLTAGSDYTIAHISVW